MEITDGNTKLSDGQQGPGDWFGHCVMLQLSSSGLPTGLCGSNADKLLDVCCCLPGAWWQLCPAAGAFTGKRQGWPQTALHTSPCLPHGRRNSYREVSQTQPTRRGIGGNEEPRSGSLGDSAYGGPGSPRHTPSRQWHFPTHQLL